MLLLDTHAVLWLLAGDSRGEPVRDRVARARTPVALSAVCVWEAAIKAALGKLRAPADLPDRLAAFDFVRLPVTERHAWGVRDLPPVHADPFDRLLVAQAHCEEAVIVSADATFDAYGVPRVW